MKRTQDTCGICLKHIAPTWIGVKSDKDWCVCTRRLDPRTGLWDHVPDLQDSVEKERHKFATKLYIERLLQHAEVGQKLKDVRRHCNVLIIDKIPHKTLLLCELPDGSQKWFRATAIANLRIRSSHDKLKERQKST